MKLALTAAAVMMTATPALAHPGHEHGVEGAMHHLAWLIAPAALVVIACVVVRCKAR